MVCSHLIDCDYTFLVGLSFFLISDCAFTILAQFTRKLLKKTSRDTVPLIISVCVESHSIFYFDKKFAKGNE